MLLPSIVPSPEPEREREKLELTVIYWFSFLSFLSFLSVFIFLLGPISLFFGISAAHIHISGLDSQVQIGKRSSPQANKSFFRKRISTCSVLLRKRKEKRGNQFLSERKSRGVFFARSHISLEGINRRTIFIDDFDPLRNFGWVHCSLPLQESPLDGSLCSELLCQLSFLFSLADSGL